MAHSSRAHGRVAGSPDPGSSGSPGLPGFPGLGSARLRGPIPQAGATVQSLPTRVCLSCCAGGTRTNGGRGVDADLRDTGCARHEFDGDLVLPCSWIALMRTH